MRHSKFMEFLVNIDFVYIKNPIYRTQQQILWSLDETIINVYFYKINLNIFMCTMQTLSILNIFDY